VTLGNLGGLSLEEGNFAAAEGFYRESLAITVEVRDPFASAIAIDGLAAVALDAGDRERAARLAGAAEALYERLGVRPDTWEQSLRDRTVAALSTTLDRATLEREWARGRAMTLHEAAAAALSEKSSHG
jgi:hypothetical protein